RSLFAAVGEGVSMRERMSAVLRHLIVAVPLLIFAGGATPAFAAETGGTLSLAAAAALANAPDTQPPAVSIASPVDGAVVRGQLTVSGTSSDDTLVATVEVKVDQGTYQTADGTTVWTLGLDTTALLDGAHTITARATDSSGNKW